MKKTIKRFIEQNIENIDQDNWEAVFQNWYDSLGDLSENDFNDFLETLNNIEIHPDLDTRKSVLLTAIENILDLFMSNTHNVSLSLVLSGLNSYLGIPEAIVKSMIFDVAMCKKLRYDSELRGFVK